MCTKQGVRIRGSDLALALLGKRNKYDCTGVEACPRGGMVQGGMGGASQDTSPGDQTRTPFVLLSNPSSFLREESNKWHGSPPRWNGGCQQCGLELAKEMGGRTGTFPSAERAPAF